MRRNCAKNPMKKPASKIEALRARFDPDADVERYLSSVDLLRNAPGKYVRDRFRPFAENLIAVYSVFSALWITVAFLSLALVFDFSVLALWKIALAFAVAGTLVLVAFWVCRAVPKISNWKLGMAGEYITEQYLADAIRRDDWHVFHGFRPDNYGDIDHIVISPKGIFAIEVKASRGEKVRQNDKGELFLDDTPLHKWNPAEQATENAERLSRWIAKEKELKLSVSVRPIVCYPDKRVRYSKSGVSVSGVIVMNPENLTTFFQNTKDSDSMTEERIQKIATAIEKNMREQE